MAAYGEGAARLSCPAVAASSLPWHPVEAVGVPTWLPAEAVSRGVPEAALAPSGQTSAASDHLDPEVPLARPRAAPGVDPPLVVPLETSVGVNV